MAVSNTFSITVQPTSALFTAAQSISAGQSVDFPGGYSSPLFTAASSSFEISWQTVSMFYDATRGEIQVMGKPQSGVSTNFSHYIYTIATNTWRTTGTSVFTGSGHVWLATFDAVEGDYYVHPYAEAFTRKMDRSTEAGAGSTNSPWTQTTTNSTIVPNSPPAAANVWHPNLLGAGQAGLVEWAGTNSNKLFRYVGTTWTEVISDLSGFLGGVFFNRSNGQGLYVPGLGCAVMCAVNASSGDIASGNIMRINDGSGGVMATPTYPGTAPSGFAPIGTSGTSLSAKWFVDPNNTSRIMALRHGGSSTAIATSINAGASWTTESYTHPFQTMAGNNGPTTNGWTAVALPSPFNCFWGLTSSGGSRLWKPNN